MLDIGLDCTRIAEDDAADHVVRRDREQVLQRGQKHHIAADRVTVLARRNAAVLETTNR